MRVTRGIVPRVLPLPETMFGNIEPAQESVGAGVR